eukprot:4380457-Prymnesium_polylepis.1
MRFRASQPHFPRSLIGNRAKQLISWKMAPIPALIFQRLTKPRAPYSIESILSTCKPGGGAWGCHPRVNDPGVHHMAVTCPSHAFIDACLIQSRPVKSRLASYEAP